METLRNFTFTWTDPRELQRAMAGRPHLDWMRDINSGVAPPPPLASAFEFVFEEAEPGRVTFAVLTLAVQAMRPGDRMATTVDLHVHMVRPALPNGQRLSAAASAVHVGTTLATAEGRVTDAAGKLIAHGTGTFAIIAAPA